ncbi:mammalian cell entry protein [Mycolicibacterium novocastrense]|uniref:MCE family protein n=1 Tax=Mycolicibacterium novocastrense TaxID=59813 RepID=UPI0007470D19|nr:MCE family protein [Mycolicibacterium novocastrense]KUH69798.1 mammalian cell entry protein [Mycolicibacterium novocastrense]KUH71347.1 mammalian cell entry protein [Mycolicibacterium novocastrense]KUH74411.1 mammalian cell entry protein [Mycolicibacterium novocastrense]
MKRRVYWRGVCAAYIVIVAMVATGCGWRGLNSLSLPGTQGGGPGAFTIQAQLPDVSNIQQNSRVRVGDVNVGTVTKIERQGWHALLTIKLNGNVKMPANSTVSVGQTSLLGSLHIELAPPTDEQPQGTLHQGSLIELSSGRAYPSTEQTLAAASLLLNGGGLGEIQDITKALSTAFTGREGDLRSLLDQLEIFIRNVNSQTDEIIAATDSLNRLVGQFSAQKPVIDRALETIPRALSVLNSERDALADAIDSVGELNALASDSIDQTKDALVKELNDLGPVLQSLADAGPALTRSLGIFATFPFPTETLSKWFRGDYANISVIADLTLSRMDSSFFTGTRWEGDLTELELQWGRTIGQLPSPYTAGNPLVAPYRWDQGR